MPTEEHSDEPRIVIAGFSSNEYANNKVKNTKYTLLSFLPLNLYEQFHMPMNAYFLLIAILQLWGEVTASNPWTTWLPLIFIFAVSAIREACDDMKRAKADRIANSKIVRCVVDGVIKEVKSEDIRKDEEIPCDIVLLSTSNEGACFIQTANIDGETDLKVRVAPKQTQNALKEPKDFHSISLRVTCPPPDSHIYKFDASMEFNKETIPLSSDNLLLQVTKVKDTDYVYGICVYTGNETKFGMNKYILPPKVTKFDKIINYFSVFIFCFQLVLAIILGIIGMVLYEIPQPWYLSKDPLYDRLSWIIYPLRFLLLNSSMIPISLKVTMEISKVFYSLFIEHDEILYILFLRLKNQYSNAKEKNVYYNSSYLAEGLGEIRYILTDKTGTLTKNEMTLKQIYANKHIPIFLIDESVRMFIRNILVNNTLKVSKDQSQFIYSGISPEEVCTVNSISAMGRLYSHDEKNNEIEIDLLGEKEHYKVIHLQEFNSNRKRTSVIVYSIEQKEYYLFAKGADDVILPRCKDVGMGTSKSYHNSRQSYRTSDHTKTDYNIYEAIDEFCGLGLRVLTYCYRKMEKEEVDSILVSIKKAENVLTNREQAKDEAYEQFEKDMYVCGACGIEDALQDNVADCIQELKDANIHVWMITGDKPKTAQEIGETTGIIDSDIPESNILLLDGTSKLEILQDIEDYISTVTQKQDDVSVYIPDVDEDYIDPKKFSLIVTGYTLVHILEKYSRSEIKHFRKLYGKNHYKDVDIHGNESDLNLLLYIRFYDLCALMDSVVCSRVTPKQKADIVNIIKLNSRDVCLSIGDGGNDVNMIRTADIGVGIEGKEGKQAARASDYVLSEFKYLPRLLLYHGYNSNRKSSYICLYSYFKSIVFCIIQTLYNMTTMLSGIAIFNSLYMSTYNIPIMAFTTDKYFIEEEQSKSYYKETQKDSFVSFSTFFFWFIIAILMALVNFIIHPILYPSFSFQDSGHIFFFTNLLCQDVIMFLFTFSITPYSILCIIISHILFALFAYLMNILYSFQGFVPYLSFNATYSSIFTYANKLTSVCFSLLLFLFFKAFISTHKRKFNVHL